MSNLHPTFNSWSYYTVTHTQTDTCTVKWMLAYEYVPKWFSGGKVCVCVCERERQGREMWSSVSWSVQRFFQPQNWELKERKTLSFADAPWSLTRCNTYAKECPLYTQAHTQWTLRWAHHWPLTHIKSPIHSLLNRHWIDRQPANWPTGQAGKSIRRPFSHTSSHSSQRQLSWPDTQLPQHRILNFYVQKIIFFFIYKPV